ncbi:hypothetical protein [Lacihabitans soyangensis]|uniref:Uncharacterized protein n=1 Tax=Lacihabitans soyangensis TaxID=869394 RepID=A0AAE3KVC3_9BACT|nr:hypothetical protein [Lacihabitans soyangensis]MCP9765983.1 hypothetical protein [Lacihabitans soyangensis]
MKKLTLFLFMAFSVAVFAQENAADSLLNDLMTDAEPATSDLLPERMLITQRMLWGQNGLYRKIGIAPKTLTAASRERELKARRNMFRVHQTLGLVTAAGMLAQGIVGSKLYKPGGYTDQLKRTHEGIATGINIGYFTTALMSFTAPPPLVNRKKFDNIKLHKILSYVHLSGMIATNVLSKQIDGNSNPANIKKWHRAAAFTTFGAYTAAIATIKFEF